ncbi:MAG: ABC transporter permease [Brevinematales bacterium]|jgi:ABC-2 type transport system permease protein
MAPFAALRPFLIKEFKQMFRDPRMRLVIFAAPIMSLLILGYAVNTDVKNVRVVVFDEDRTSMSRELIEKFTGSGYFEVYRDLDSSSELDGILDKGDSEVYIHIEKDFSKKIRGGKITKVQIIVDGTDSSRAAVIVSYVNQITAGYSFDYFNKRIKLFILNKGIRGVKFRQNIVMKQRVLFNPDLSSRNFFLPVVLGLVVSLITIVLTAMSIVKERETGTIDQLIVSPIHPYELIAGKTIPFILVSFLDVIIVTTITIFWFGVPFNGNIFFLLFACLLFIISTVSIGLYISTISKSQQEALLSTFLYFIPSMLLSGFIFPVYSMPAPVRPVTLINPMLYFVNIIRGVFLRGTSLPELWKDLLALFLIGSILFYLSARRFRRRLE